MNKPCMVIFKLQWASNCALLIGFLSYYNQEILITTDERGLESNLESKWAVLLWQGKNSLNLSHRLITTGLQSPEFRNEWLCFLTLGKTGVSNDCKFPMRDFWILGARYEIIWKRKFRCPDGVSYFYTSPRILVVCFVARFLFEKPEHGCGRRLGTKQNKHFFICLLSKFRVVSTHS